jgi:hypothetical protein
VTGRMRPARGALTVLLAAGLGACAAQSGTQPSRTMGEPGEKLPTVPRNPDDVRGWIEVAELHEAELARLVPEARTLGPPREALAPDALPRPRARPLEPAPPSYDEPEATTVAKPSRRTGAFRWYRRRLAKERYETAPLSRCARACRHVAAICYAATRICHIADRLNEPGSRTACTAAQRRCQDAQETARRGSCGTCSAP